MKIYEIIDSIDIENFNQEAYEQIKKNKISLSNGDKKILTKILANAKVELKEKVLKAIVCYAIWEPDEAIETGRRKGIFRYKVFGIKTRNYAKYYMTFLLEYASIFNFSEKAKSYLVQKIDCDWLDEFYIKKETEIDRIIEEHHKKRIRKRIKKRDGKRIYYFNLESSLHKELLAYIDMIFFSGTKLNIGTNFNTLDSFSREEIAEGVSYLLYKYTVLYGIDKEKNYFVDANFVNSKEMETLLLYACQINYMIEIELLVDFYDYDIFTDGKNITIKSRDDSLEKSIRMAYIKNEMQEVLFYARGQNVASTNALNLQQVSNLFINELEEKFVKNIKDGILSRYVFEIPVLAIEKIAEQNVEGRITLYEEEALEIEHFAKEICMTTAELYEKKITDNCNVYDVMLCQRLFRFVYYMQKEVYDKEKEWRKIIQSLIPITSREQLIQYLTMFLKNREKAEEIYRLLEYNTDCKFDIQYTPFISIGEKVIYPISILAQSNLIRNTIAYSYMSKNQYVNDDGGLESLVSVCASSFESCTYGYKVFTNKKYKYMGKKGEIDVIVVSDEEIILVECKAPLMPTSNFEMRATFEHIEKASRQLDLSKMAFEDDGFRKKYFKDGLGMDGKERVVRTCIVLGNRLFSIWSSSKHPVRYIYELDMILNNGEIRSPFTKWSIWKGENYTHDDLVDFLSQEGQFMEIMQDSMDMYSNTINFKGKNITYESFMWNMERLYYSCDEKLRILEKDEEEWDHFVEACNSVKRVSEEVVII